MRTITAYSNALDRSFRLDSKFFLEKENLREIVSGSWPLTTVGETFGGRILHPDMFERVPASSLAYGKPLLVPYDCFRYLPASNYFLSKSQIRVYDSLELKRGWLLIVRSGRNLGPVSMADNYLTNFVLSDDMLRICVEPTDDAFYFAAVMNTRVGQALMRRDRNGSVIDHLEAHHISSLSYPIVSSKLKRAVQENFRAAFLLREDARMSLKILSEQYLDCVGLRGFEDTLSKQQTARRFTVLRSDIVGRIDSEPRAPRYEAIRKAVHNTGQEEKLGDLATVFKPQGRYKTNYVDNLAFGLKLLSGRQIAQYRPIGLKIMSRRAWKKPEEYALSKGMILLTADGRAEENLADCAMVCDDRHGWAASGHVHRLLPNHGVNPGLLYLACCCSLTQGLLKSLSTGSVVDALSTQDVGSVTVAYPRTRSGEDLGNAATAAWNKFAEAYQLESEAVEKLEKEFAS